MCLCRLNRFKETRVDKCNDLSIRRCDAKIEQVGRESSQVQRKRDEARERMKRLQGEKRDEEEKRSQRGKGNERDCLATNERLELAFLSESKDRKDGQQENTPRRARFLVRLWRNVLLPRFCRPRLFGNRKEQKWVQENV